MQTEILLHSLHQPPLNCGLNELNSCSHSTGLFMFTLYRVIHVHTLQDYSYSHSTGLFNTIFYNFKHSFARIWRVVIK